MSDLARLRVQLAFIKLDLVLRRKYRPDQPRVPAGNPDGGQFTDGSGGRGSGRVRLAQGDRLQGYVVDLREEEARGGHTIRDHVARSPDRLLARVREEQSATTRKRDFAEGLAVGSFPSLDSATRLVNSTLAQNSAIIEPVASGALPYGTIHQRFGSPTGYEAYAATERSQPYIRETTSVSVHIRHDPLSKRGFRVLTAFPSNIRR
jgi:hypothetical protein